jgi:hypothetical protein
MLVHRGREEEDFTRDRSDFKDSTIIARRVADRHCYVPYALEGHWCRLRHLGARRNDQLVEFGGARQCLRDLLEVGDDEAVGIGVVGSAVEHQAQLVGVDGAAAPGAGIGRDLARRQAYQNPESARTRGRPGPRAWWPPSGR